MGARAVRLDAPAGPATARRASSATGLGLTLPGQIAVKVVVKMVACGRGHAVALDGEAGLWAWGETDRGQTGMDGEVLSRFFTPRPVPTHGRFSPPPLSVWKP